MPNRFFKSVQINRNMAVYCLRAARRRSKRRRLLLLAASLLILHTGQSRKRSKTTRSIWQRKWLGRRDNKGAYNTLLSELRREDEGSFLNFLRLSPGLFQDLLSKVSPLIQRSDTFFRKAISPGMRLAITMRYLATGESFKSLSFLFRVANNTIGTIVPETCGAIYQVLAKDYFKCPKTTEEWLDVAREYYTKWNFPNCLGSLDGKHVVIRKPACSGAQFFNYKHSFSLILLALVDANYRFLFVDIGRQGRCSDGGVFSESDLNKAIQNNTLGLPEASPLPGREEPFPYVMVADDAFPLKDFMMKPFPQRNLSYEHRIYNYRVSRARRCVENAFSIMAARFRVLLSPICISPEKVDKVIFACCALHNMLRTLAPSKYIVPSEPNMQHGDQLQGKRGNEDDILAAAKVSSRRSASKLAQKYREYLVQYFMSEEGQVSWQDSML